MGGTLSSETDISFDLTGPADVTVRVYNASGRLERVIARDTPMAPGRNSLAWDGRDDGGALVPPGIYLYRIEVESETERGVAAGTVAVVY